tara:strand:- start:37 stop:999 length:963 start_codon:yes stop_codon:yes gene_type:complete
MENILEIKNLHTYFFSDEAQVKAVENLNLKVKKGEVLALVGESACGKSVSAYSVMGLIDSPGKIVKGEIIFKGQDLLKLPKKKMQAIRGQDISLVFQEPGSSLNPLYTIGLQIDEMIRAHNKTASKEDRGKRILELLNKVGISNPQSRIKDYPYNFSGGQAQRIMIAMALSCEPKLLIADEPTTSLDVTIQAQIMNLFMRLRQELDFTLILITHNLALCSEVADRVAIMYAGRIVEEALIEEIFKNPLHPYTKALFASIPQAESKKARLKVIKGAVADPSAKPSGCHFHPRCPLAKNRCKVNYPEYREISPGHSLSCFEI